MGWKVEAGVRACHRDDASFPWAEANKSWTHTEEQSENECPLLVYRLDVTLEGKTTGTERSCTYVKFTSVIKIK